MAAILFSSKLKKVSKKRIKPETKHEIIVLLSDICPNLKGSELPVNLSDRRKYISDDCFSILADSDSLSQCIVNPQSFCHANV